MYDDDDDDNNNNNNNTAVPRLRKKQSAKRISAKRVPYIRKNSCSFGYFRSFRWAVCTVMLLVMWCVNIMNLLKSQNMN
jgi:hypothetical protein